MSVKPSGIVCLKLSQPKTSKLLFYFYYRGKSTTGLFTS